MVQSAANRLTEFLQEEIGEALRAVVLLSADGWDAVYLRSDLREAYDEETFGLAVDAFRDTTLDTPDIEPLPVGARHAAVFYHENAFILQFRYSQPERILVSITPEAGRNLLAFIESCRVRVHPDQ